MYLKNANKNVEGLMERLDKLDNENQIKFIAYLLNLWNNALINNLNSINPSVLDDDVDIKIFNPNSIGYSYALVKEIIEYLNYNFNLCGFYQKEYISLISVYEELSFKDKIKMFAEIFLFMEQKSLLPSNVDGYEIARLILKY